MFNLNDIGSGGGSFSYGVGGVGGGYFCLIVVRVVKFEGIILVIGISGEVLNSGGGSGGSVWILVGDI